MTLLKRRAVRGDGPGLSYSVIANGVMTAAVLAMATWIWNTSESGTRMAADVSGNTSAIADLKGRVDRLADVVANHGAAISNVQTLQTATGQSVSDRLRALEWAARSPQARR